jgi:hypothetical protein
MLTTRAVVISLVTLVALSVVGVVIGLMQPPDSGGLARDSYGTRAYGHRALYEILTELGVPAERGLVPPDSLRRDDVCLVLWNPDRGMIQLEPAHLAKVAEWVCGGGKVIVAPPNRVSSAPVVTVPRKKQETSALNELGLPEVVLSSVDPRSDSSATVVPRPARQTGATKASSYVPTEKPRDLCAVQTQASGCLAAGGEAVRTLIVPAEELSVIDVTQGPQPAGTVSYQESDGTVRTLAAVYALGDGEITVVAEPSLFRNDCIGRADNAVLAVSLFHRAGRRAVFDEFYHGLTVRGNPAWLLTRQPYGLCAAMLVLACLLWAWREGVHLGPPLPEKTPGRRTLREYVDAMANLFYRNGCHAFVLREVRDGVLWAVRKRLGLGPRSAHVADVARALARRDAAAAESLEQGAAAAETVLSGKNPPTETFVIPAARKLSQCL